MVFEEFLKGVCFVDVLVILKIFDNCLLDIDR